MMPNKPIAVHCWITSSVQLPAGLPNNAFNIWSRDMTQPRLRMRLGDLLVAERIISAERLELGVAAAETASPEIGCRAGLSWISWQRQLLMFLAQQLDIPFSTDETDYSAASRAVDP